MIGASFLFSVFKEYSILFWEIQMESMKCQEWCQVSINKLII